MSTVARTVHLEAGDQLCENAAVLKPVGIHTAIHAAVRPVIITIVADRTPTEAVKSAARAEFAIINRVILDVRPVVKMLRLCHESPK